MAGQRSFITIQQIDIQHRQLYAQTEALKRQLSQMEADRIACESAIACGYNDRYMINKLNQLKHNITRMQSVIRQNMNKLAELERKYNSQISKMYR